MSYQARNSQPPRRGSMPPKHQDPTNLNIASTTSFTEEWQPSESQLENQINAAIEDIRSTLQVLQSDIGASDRYLLGLLDVVADDYRAQLPAGKS
mgnify:CR=1 FL=1